MNNMRDIKDMKKRKAAIRKERIIMLSASAFVLTALTMTGVYVREKNKDMGESRVELDELNNTSQGSAAKEQLPTVPSEVSLADDLDADPYYQETNSRVVENPQFNAAIADAKRRAAEDARAAVEGKSGQNKQEESTDNTAEDTASVTDENNEISTGENTNQEALSTATVNYTFPTEQVMQWPVTGNILINYSMDKPVYFETLQQYKYSPAIVLSATQGDQVIAAAGGLVKSVSSTTELGNIVVFDLGDGYELTYGQLCDIAVKEGDVVSTGQLIGAVEKTTMFYSMEGNNLYIKMTHNGQPENPIAYMD